MQEDDRRAVAALAVVKRAGAQLDPAPLAELWRDRGDRSIITAIIEA